MRNGFGQKIIVTKNATSTAVASSPPTITNVISVITSVIVFQICRYKNKQF